jgi:hypothetical protein
MIANDYEVHDAVVYDIGQDLSRIVLDMDSSLFAVVASPTPLPDRTSNANTSSRVLVRRRCRKWRRRDGRVKGN